MIRFKRNEYYIKWGFESRLKQPLETSQLFSDYIKWGFESRLKLVKQRNLQRVYYIKWGFESRLKLQIEFQ